MVRNGEADLGKRLELWVRIQENVNYLIDNTHAPIAMNAPPGIKNILEVFFLSFFSSSFVSFFF